MTAEVLERPTAMAEINMAHAAAALAEDYAQDADLPLRYAYTWQHLNRGRYAEQVLRRGPLRCVDPIDGTLRSATSAHVLCGDWLGIIYHFEGVEPFWLVTSSFDQAKLGLYLPRREVFIAGPVDPNWVTIGHDAVRSHLRLAATAEPWTGPVKPEASVLYLGFCNNLGHTMWNDLSGLEAAVDAGMLDRVAAVVAGPHTFFPVDALFPELAAAGVPVIRRPKDAPPCVRHDAASLPLRLTSNRITRSLRRRIVAWALQAEQASLASLAPLNGPGLNLWCNLRQHNKTWVDQVDGLVALAKVFAGALKGQPVRLLLDGTRDTAPLAARIAEALSGQVDVVDATQVPLSRTVVMCGLVDLHLCVVGSGLTLPHWVMGRRGVAHGNRPHLGQQSFWNNVSEGTHDVDFVPMDAVQDMDGPLTHDPSYVNYRLDVQAVLSLLETRFRQLDTGPRRSGFQQMLALVAQGRLGDAAERLINV
ncbi:MAG: hypothetical protein ACK57J_11965 [Rubrivivax sp.]